MGLMQMNRLGQGVVCSPSIAQEKLQTLLDDLPGVAIYVDDIILYSNTVEEHEKLIREVLRRIGKAGYKLNHKKCQFFKKEVIWLGMKIGVNTIEPAEDYIEKLQAIATPRNTRDVKRVLGPLRFTPVFVRILRRKRSLLCASLERTRNSSGGEKR